jgi:hypothetical protein
LPETKSEVSYTEYSSHADAVSFEFIRRRCSLYLRPFRFILIGSAVMNESKSIGAPSRRNKSNAAIERNTFRTRNIRLVPIRINLFVDDIPSRVALATYLRRSAQLAVAARTPAFAVRVAADRHPHLVAAGSPVASPPVESYRPHRMDRDQPERARRLRNPADAQPAPANNQA